jgi:hypothetical protein
MILSAHQPNYLPYLGFFDKMIQSDVFVIQDNFQFERHDFQNRNRIKTPNGVQWLTVPVEHCSRDTRIDEVTIAKLPGPLWTKKHWEALKYNYMKAPCWGEFGEVFEQVYKQNWTKLIDLNMYLIKLLMKLLKIETPLILSSSLEASGQKTERLLAQCKELGADVYLSGIGGRNYLDVQRMEQAGVKVIFQDFQHPVYPQLHGEFVPNLSVVDYLFCAQRKTLKTQIPR